MRLIIVLLSLSLAGPAFAQHAHSDTGQLVPAPRETGQSAFAALAEIVSILREDSDTDWEAVEIDGLRRHLVDMDLLTTEAEVTAVPRVAGVRFDVRGTPRVLEAIRAMVPAHAPFLAAETGWDVSTEEADDGVALIVDGDGAQIWALGFFGIMAVGAHHQEHHLMLARGAAPHP